MSCPGSGSEQTIRENSHWRISVLQVGISMAKAKANSSAWYMISRVEDLLDCGRRSFLYLQVTHGVAGHPCRSRANEVGELGQGERPHSLPELK